ncbi:sugar transferase [Patescibacteria group bacterium]|nr:sugar transferase [Patescibacteria group bacterium]
MFYKITKRIIDIVGALIGLIILAPFTIFIALAIKIDSRGSVFVKLDRVSKGNIIKLYKFRSMVIDAEEKKGDLLILNERQDGPFFKIKNDSRITKVGKFLRKFRLDEFPQLMNVLKGDISLVGPRPHEPEEMFFYPQEHRELFLAKTGMTGISQTNGASGLPFLKELEFDTYYLKNQSLWLDIKILFKTFIIFFTDPTGV